MKWKEIISSGFEPIFRHGHQAVVHEDIVYFYGGGHNKICKQLHGYKIKENICFLPKINGKIPPGLANFGMEVFNNVIIIFGGMLEYGHYSNILYTLNLKCWTWKRLANSCSNIPSPRIGHSFTLTDDKRIIIFGGLINVHKHPEKANTPKYMNDLYVLHIVDEEKFKWEKLTQAENGPCERESHSAVFHHDTKEQRKFIIIFGGMNGERLHDLWFFDLLQMIWIQFEVSGLPPAPRSLHTANIINSKMYIFGGWVEKVPKKPSTVPAIERFETTNLLTYLDLEDMSWNHFENYNDLCPSPRAGHAMAAHNTRLYLFSGRSEYKKKDNGDVCLRDFWYLETELPSKVTNISLIKATRNTLEIKWDEVQNAECYLVEIRKIQTAAIDLSKIRIKANILLTNEKKVVEPAKDVPVKRKSDEINMENEKKLLLTPKQEAVVIDENQNVQAVKKTEIISLPAPVKIAQTNSEKSWLSVGIFKTNTCVVDGFYAMSIDTKDLSCTNCPSPREFKSDLKVQLVRDSMYALRVASINMMGVSEWSKMFCFKTNSDEKPSAPNNCKFIPTTDSLRLAWNPNMQVEKITSYAVFIAIGRNIKINDFEYLRVYEGPQPTCRVERTILKSAYREKVDKRDCFTFRILANNIHGPSPPLTVTFLE